MDFAVTIEPTLVFLLMPTHLQNEKYGLLSSLLKNFIATICYPRY